MTERGSFKIFVSGACSSADPEGGGGGQGSGPLENHKLYGFLYGISNKTPLEKVGPPTPLENVGPPLEP